MKRCLAWFLWLGLVSSALAAPADVVLYNGQIATMDPARSWASALAIEQGKISWIGWDPAEQIGPNTEVVDLKGQMVLPGFTDSHVHLVLGGIEADQCPLADSPDAGTVFERIRTYAQHHPDRPWILGAGWDTTEFGPQGPTRQQLDELVGDRPAWLYTSDGHSGWANSKALELAGITAATAEPAAGRIERDPEGNPRGVLRESAMALMEKVVPPTTAADYEKHLPEVIRLANSFGITAVDEANTSEPMLQAYQALEKRGELNLRVLASLQVDLPLELDKLKALRRRYDGPRLKATAAKLFLDGVIESRTAALLEPYLGEGPQGELNLQPGPIVAALDAAGFQVHLHAIGDRAVRAGLDAFAALPRRDGRHHIAHLQLVHPEDHARFRQLGVVANIQPLWAFPDKYITELTEPVLGPERSARLYPFASLLEAGAVMAAGSDWSVSSLNPLEAIEVAVTRHDPAAPASLAWHAEQCLRLTEVLAAYTNGGAWVTFQERQRGSLEVGKWADLIVLERNLYEIPPEQISETRVVLTMLEGKEVYRRQP